MQQRAHGIGAALVALGIAAGVCGASREAAAHEGFYASFGIGTAMFTDDVITAGRPACGNFCWNVGDFGGRTAVKNPSMEIAAKQTAQTSLAGLVRLGYDISGLVGIELNVAGNGWSLFKNSRGGGGLIGGALRLEPIEYIARATHKIMPAPERAWDVTVPFGAGWTIIGQNKDDSQGLIGFAYDGSYFQTGALLEYYPLSNGSRALALGVDLNVFVPFYGDKLFTNFGNSQYVSAPAPSPIILMPMFTIAGHFLPAPNAAIQGAQPAP